MRYTPSYHTACQLQDKVLGQIGLIRLSRSDRKKLEKPVGKNLKPAELSSLVKSWELLEERKRILRMRPLPKAVAVPPTERPKAKPPSFSET